MESTYPYPKSEGVRSIAVDLILTVVTCGFYGLYWQYKQMEALNAWLGRQDYSFAMWFLLGLVTCGFFAVYYEYKMATGIIEIQGNYGLRESSDLPLICILLSIFGLAVVSLAIQQGEINKFYNETSDM